MAETDPTTTTQAGETPRATESSAEACTIAPAAQANAAPVVVTAEEERPLMQDFLEAFGEIRDWAMKNPLGSVLWVGILATLTYFFWVMHPFFSGTESALAWARGAWNPEGDQSYGAFVPVIALGLVFYHWGPLRRAPKEGVNGGLGWVIVGILTFILAVRCLQPRMALVSIPFILYGITLYVWGKRVARIVLFPCVFLIFMVPVGALTQATFKLQFVVTGSIGVLARMIGVNVVADGTTLTAIDNSFKFDIVEGCSGIRSLMAMVMITAAYVHLTQDRLWKKVVIFGSSIVFAVIGNIGRVFSIILVAKFWSKDFASGAYHDTSGWIFFPVALGAMLLCDRIVNLDFAKLLKSIQEAMPDEESMPKIAADAVAPETAPAESMAAKSDKETEPAAAEAGKSSHATSHLQRYDY